MRRAFGKGKLDPTKIYFYITHCTNNLFQILRYILVVKMAVMVTFNLKSVYQHLATILFIYLNCQGNKNVPNRLNILRCI